MLRLIRSGLAIAGLVLFTLLWGSAALLVYPFDRSGWAAAWVTRRWGRSLLWACGARVEARGLEMIEPQSSYVLAGNHQSALDIPALLAVLPVRFGLLAKKELFYIPFFGQVMWATGTIPIDRSHPRRAVKGLKRAAERLAVGRSIFVFPEGTRSRTGELLPFKSGGFVLARDSGRPVVPVSIEGSMAVLPPGRWLLGTPGTVRITIGEPVDPKGLRKDDLAREARRRVESLMDQSSGGQPSERLG